MSSFSLWSRERLVKRYWWRGSKIFDYIRRGAGVYEGCTQFVWGGCYNADRDKDKKNSEFVEFIAEDQLQQLVRFSAGKVVARAEAQAAAKTEVDDEKLISMKRSLQNSTSISEGSSTKKNRAKVRDAKIEQADSVNALMVI
jgi:hypothetical protein